MKIEKQKITNKNLSKKIIGHNKKFKKLMNNNYLKKVDLGKNINTKKQKKDHNDQSLTSNFFEHKLVSNKINFTITIDNSAKMLEVKKILHNITYFMNNNEAQISFIVDKVNFDNVFFYIRAINKNIKIDIKNMSDEQKKLVKQGERILKDRMNVKGMKLLKIDFDERV